MSDPGNVDAIHRREDLEFVAAGVFVVAVVWAMYTLSAGAPQPPAVFWAHTLLALVLAARYVIWPRWWWQNTPRSHWANLLTLLTGVVTVFVIELITGGETTAYFYLIAIEGGLAFGSPGGATSRPPIGWWLLFIGGLALISHVICLGWWAGVIVLFKEAPTYLIVMLAAVMILQQNTYRTRIEDLMAELADTHAQLQDYTARAEVLAVAEERTRLAREIHDTLGHTLTTLDVQMELLARLPPDQSEQRTEVIDQSRVLVKEGLADVRRAVKALRPGALDVFPLPAAIQSLVDEFRRTTGLAVVYQVSGDHSSLPARLSLPLYRAAQEALTNVRRHALKTTRVIIALNFALSEVCLRVDDDGCGGPPAEGFGLRGLRERAEELGGEFSAGPRQPIGFTLQMKLPR